MSAWETKDFEKKAHFTFFWIIEKFSKNFLSVESPTFTVQFMEDTRCSLRLKTKFCDSIYIQIHRKEGSGIDSIGFVFAVEILTNDGFLSAMPTQYITFQKNDSFIQPGFVENELLNRKTMSFPNDRLIIRCQMWKMDTEILNPETCFGHSRLGMDQFTSVWTIENFNNLQPGQIRTHCLNPASNRSPRLHLKLFLTERCGKYYVNIQINQNHAMRYFYMTSKFTVLNPIMENRQSKEIQNVISPNQEKVYTYQAIFEREELIGTTSHLLRYVILDIYCEFVIDTEPIWNRYSSCVYLDSESAATEILKMQFGVTNESCTAACPFMKTLENMYGDENLSDVTLRTGDVSLPAHKSVLSARSPVFKAMFTYDMREKTRKLLIFPISELTLWDVCFCTFTRTLLKILNGKV